MQNRVAAIALSTLMLLWAGTTVAQSPPPEPSPNRLQGVKDACYAASTTWWEYAWCVTEAALQPSPPSVALDACKLLAPPDVTPLMLVATTESSACPDRAHYYSIAGPGTGDCGGYPADGPLREWCPPSALWRTARLVEINLRLVTEAPRSVGGGEALEELGEGARIISSTNETGPVDAERTMTIAFACGARVCLIDLYVSEAPPIRGGAGILHAQAIALAHLVQDRAGMDGP